MGLHNSERNLSMSNTVTLISSLKNACLTPDVTSEITTCLKALTTKTLYPNVASDFELPASMNTQEALALIKSIIKDKPIDSVVQTSKGRRKKLFLADMDSTIIGQECIDELAAEIGVKEQVSKITEAAMNGEIDFEGALNDRVALLAGLEESIVSTVLEKRIVINYGARESLSVMGANGTYSALVSGGFTVFASQIAREVGFHEYHANTLLSEGGKFTGKVKMPILGQQAKLDQLNRLSSEKNISLEETIAIGDGANDLPMLMNAGTGIAYHAKPAVAAKAQVVINHADLSAILFVQGYTKKDIDAAMA